MFDTYSNLASYHAARPVAPPVAPPVAALSTRPVAPLPAPILPTTPTLANHFPSPSTRPINAPAAGPEGETLALTPFERRMVLLIRAEMEQAGLPVASQQAWAKLSTRERDVARLLCQGYSNKQIARALTIKGDTVKNHITNIFRRLCVDKREEAIILLLPAIAMNAA